MDLPEAIDRLTQGDYSGTEVIARVFSGFIDDDRVSLNRAINGQCHKGLRTAIKERRWRHHIAQAVALIDHEGATNHSLAVTLHNGFQRLERSARAPVTPLGKALAAALQAHPRGGTSVQALSVVVGAVR